jgi:biotin operon repressor
MGDPSYVRDSREPGHFWADNEVVDHYLPAIGVYGFAVYMLLTKYADAKTGQCDPSVEGMARKLGISAPTVRKALERLEKSGLITIRHRHREKAGKLINQTSLYTLLAIKKPKDYVPGKSPLVGREVDRPGKGDLVPLVKEVDQGTKGDLQGVLKDVSTNNTHENKTHVGGGENQDKGDSRSAPAPLFEKLAETCRIPLALATHKQRAELGKAATKLNDIGATPEQLDRFLAWWDSDSNWRSRKAREQQRKPEAPRPVEVLEEWGNATSTPVRRPANGPAPPVSTRPPDAVPAGEAMRRVLDARKANQS